MADRKRRHAFRPLRDDMRAAPEITYDDAGRAFDDRHQTYNRQCLRRRCSYGQGHRHTSTVLIKMQRHRALKLCLRDFAPRRLAFTRAANAFTFYCNSA